MRGKPRPESHGVAGKAKIICRKDNGGRVAELRSQGLERVEAGKVSLRMEEGENPRQAEGRDQRGCIIKAGQQTKPSGANARENPSLFSEETGKRTSSQRT